MSKINNKIEKEKDSDDEDEEGNLPSSFQEYEKEANEMYIPPKDFEQNPNLEEPLTSDGVNPKFDTLKKQTENALKGSVRRKSQTNFLKSLVSKDKNRFCFDGFDLDLTYITPRIIAMGYPSTSIEGFYRNNLANVKSFFNSRHTNHYKVYNLCEEKRYDDNIFYKQGYFPFRDHEAPPLNLLRPFCEDCKKFLDEDENNVIAIHCKAGKGRTGTCVSCLLLYLNIFETAAECLKYYGQMRVENGRGVTVPSQIRYVFYFEKIIKLNIPHPIKFKTVCIKKIKMVTIPNVSKMGSSCTPTFTIENTVDKTKNEFKYSQYNKKKETYDIKIPYVDFMVGDEGFNVTGDVRILFYQINLFGKDKLFKIWFNTNFIPEDGVLEVKKDLIDKACKDKDCKKYKYNFKIEIHTIDV